MNSIINHTLFITQWQCQSWVLSNHYPNLLEQPKYKLEGEDLQKYISIFFKLFQEN